MYNIYKLNFIS